MLARATARAKDAAFLQDDASELLARVDPCRSELVLVRHRLTSLQSVAPKATARSGRWLPWPTVRHNAWGAWLRSSGPSWWTCATCA